VRLLYGGHDERTIHRNDMRADTWVRPYEIFLKKYFYCIIKTEKHHAMAAVQRIVEKIEEFMQYCDKLY